MLTIPTSLHIAHGKRVCKPPDRSAFEACGGGNVLFQMTMLLSNHYMLEPY